MDRLNTTIVILIFVVAAALRLDLSVVSLESNDDHMRVSRLIVSEGRLPAAGECWECHQPKLFHVLVAMGIELGEITDWNEQIRMAQMISCFAGILTIALCWYFLVTMPLRRRVKLWAFAMVALNPGLIAINAQATNDSLVILFGTCTIYFLYRFFSQGGGWYFAALVIFSILAALTKSSALILFPVILFIFALKALRMYRTVPDRTQHRYNWYVLVFVVLFLAIVPLGGQYVRVQSQHISIFPTNFKKQPFPNFFKKTYYGNPGITSVANSYLTFRLVDMLKHPTFTDDWKIYPLHRTSFWSQLYGRVHSIYFSPNPKSWQTKDPGVLNLCRVILVLALIPTGIFLWGFLKEMWRWSIALARFDLRFISMSNNWIFFPFALAQITSLFFYTAVHRGFPSIKAIFLLPSLLAGTYLFTVGLSAAYGKIGKTFWRVFLDFALGILVVLYSVSVLTLIMKLLKFNQAIS